MTEPNEVRMSFAEHLEELRSRILRSLGAFFLVAVVSLVFQKELFKFYIEPYREAVASIAERSPPRISYEQRYIQALVGWLLKNGMTEEDLAAVEAEVGPPPGDAGVTLSAVAVTETFMAHLKIALLTAAILSAPVMLYQMWQFIGAGLYDTERRAVVRVLPFSLIMFSLGILFGFQLLVPVSLDFLLSYGDPEFIRQTTTVSSYLSLLFILLFVMGLVFQVPLVMTVLSGLGLIGPKTFRTRRKYFVLGAVVCAAVLTPPDYVTQCLVAMPMVVLYEVGVLLAVLADRRRRRKLAEEMGSSAAADG